MALHTEPLDQEDQDSIVQDARAGDLDSLHEIFDTLIHPKLLVTCTDSISHSSALHMASANGHINVVKYLLGLVDKETEGSDILRAFVNQQNETGNTALHWASLNGKLDVVQLLCDEYDADPFIRNNFGHDSIYEAENNGREQLESYFLKKYDIEPEQDNDQPQATTNNVEIKEGTEIEQVTKEATEVLLEKTEQLKINEN